MHRFHGSTTSHAVTVEVRRQNGKLICVLVHPDLAGPFIDDAACQRQLDAKGFRPVDGNNQLLPAPADPQPMPRALELCRAILMKAQVEEWSRLEVYELRDMLVMALFFEKDRIQNEGQVDPDRYDGPFEIRATDVACAGAAAHGIDQAHDLEWMQPQECRA